MRKKRGFTLTEILISILIIGIVMSAVMTLFVSVFKSYEFHQDIMEAKQRGQIALAAIEPLVLNSGLGIPAVSKDFMEVFKDNNRIIPQSATPTNNQNFSGPVQIATVSGGGVSEAVVTIDSGNDLDTTDEKYTGDSLWIVYSVSSGYGISKLNIVGEILSDVSLEMDPDADFTPLKDNLDIYVNSNSSLKSWVAFPSSRFPFKVLDDSLTNSTTPLGLRTTKRQFLHRFDELHYVRASKIKIDAGNNLSIYHLVNPTPDSYQPVVEGIYGMRCVFDRDGDRILTVTVLARADTLRPELNINSVDGWQGAIPDGQYRYAAVSKSWRIRN
ncbi:PilW family protein [Aminivibrio sp.]|jgi:prepilin-type N-terminal cleavage/methylation domain-containing protein|uniref:PilW family protein n=1 Tax=Aminivibrio sp. TaxID=1872489 RepID=UPI003D99B2F4